MRKLTAMVMATTLALVAANLAYAAKTAATTTQAELAKAHPHYKSGSDMHQAMMFKNLNLTDSQKQQIREIMKAQRDNMPRPSLDDRRAMHLLVTSDSFDRAKAEEAVNKMAGQHKERMLSRMETQNKIYSILTPEQKKQFNANFEKQLAERPAKPGKMSEAVE